jgi:predicted transcriptional regulator of viral defense system
MITKRRNPETYVRTKGLKLVEALVSGGHLVFTTAEAHASGLALGIPRLQVNIIVARLAGSSWVRRLRRGLYALTDRAPGGRAPHDFAVATALVQPSAIAGWSALSFHGLTEQVPRGVTCMTTRKVMTPSMRRSDRQDAGPHRWLVGGLAITYTQVTAARYFGITDVWVDAETRVPMTDRERTVLDLFVPPTRAMDFGAAMGVLEEHRASLDLPKLVRYAVELRVAAVAKRLGWALETLGVEESVTTPLLAVPVRAIQLLDPAREAKGPVIARWKLQDNLASPVRR